MRTGVAAQAPARSRGRNGVRSIRHRARLRLLAIIASLCIFVVLFLISAFIVAVFEFGHLLE